MSFIGSADVTGKVKPKPQPAKPTLSPEAQKALEFMRTVDSGMTLTRFQIEAAMGEGASELDDALANLDDAIEVIGLLGPSASRVALALKSLAQVVDFMDMDLEDIAKEALK